MDSNADTYLDPISRDGTAPLPEWKILLTLNPVELSDLILETCRLQQSWDDAYENATHRKMIVKDIENEEYNRFLAIHRWWGQKSVLLQLAKSVVVNNFTTTTLWSYQKLGTDKCTTRGCVVSNKHTGPCLFANPLEK